MMLQEKESYLDLRRLPTQFPLRSTVLPRAGDAPIPSEFPYLFAASHVLLTACRQEHAFESELGGKLRSLFTHHLLQRLAEVALDCITPVELVDSLQRILHQDPQCEGFNKYRRLF